jgi:ketosteroid isomerase-like protein
MSVYDRSRRNVLAVGAAIGLAAGLGGPAASHAEATVHAPRAVGWDARQMEAATGTLQRLLDEQDIRRVVDEIDNAVDAKDWAACRGYFADTIDVDFTSLAGGAPGRGIPADALVGAWRRNLYAEKKSHHMRSNHRIVVDGDRAEVFSKGYAFNMLPSPTGSDLWEVWGDYRHALTRTATGWKVTSMSLAVTYARGNERARDFVPQG